MGPMTNEAMLSNERDVLKITHIFYQALLHYIIYQGHQSFGSHKIGIRMDPRTKRRRHYINYRGNNKYPGEDRVVLTAIKEGGQTIIKASNVLFNNYLDRPRKLQTNQPSQPSL